MEKENERLAALLSFVLGTILTFVTFSLIMDFHYPFIFYFTLKNQKYANMIQSNQLIMPIMRIK